LVGGKATFTFEDDRFSYAEQRFVTLGLLAGIPVSVVQTESENEIRIISFRKAMGCCRFRGHQPKLFELSRSLSD
jgi:uncharacterized DUF497 family protein